MFQAVESSADRLLADRLLNNREIVDTVERVFSNPAYNLERSSSIFSIIERWFFSLLQNLFSTFDNYPWLNKIARWTVIIVAILIVGRIVFVMIKSPRNRLEYKQKYTVNKKENPWNAAARLSAEGNFEEAAHALYAAILSSLFNAGYIAFHDSKTAGDYRRELKKGSRYKEEGNFTGFARLYENVVYGIGSCDSEMYEKLNHLADPFRKVR